MHGLKGAHTILCPKPAARTLASRVRDRSVVGVRRAALERDEVVGGGVAVEKCGQSRLILTLCLIGQRARTALDGARGTCEICATGACADRHRMAQAAPNAQRARPDLGATLGWCGESTRGMRPYR